VTTIRADDTRATGRWRDNHGVMREPGGGVVGREAVEDDPLAELVNWYRRDEGDNMTDEDLLNEGAQDERDSVRARLKRRLRWYNKKAQAETSDVRASLNEAKAQAIAEELRWVDGRIKRFAKRKGGLEGPGR
jgi:hypothetical protein